MPQLYECDSQQIDSELNIPVYTFNQKKSTIIYSCQDANCQKKDVKNWKKDFFYSKSFYMWVKPTGTVEETRLISIADQNGKYLLSIKINKNQQLIVQRSDNTILYTTSETIQWNQWNYIALYIKRKVEIDSSDYYIVINQWISSGKPLPFSSKNIEKLVIARQSIVIDNVYRPTKTILQSCLIGISTYELNNKRIEEIYKKGKESFKSENQYHTELKYYQYSEYDENSEQHFYHDIATGQIEQEPTFTIQEEYNKRNQKIKLAIGQNEIKYQYQKTRLISENIFNKKIIQYEYNKTGTIKRKKSIKTNRRANTR